MARIRYSMQITSITVPIDQPKARIPTTGTALPTSTPSIAPIRMVHTPQGLVRRAEYGRRPRERESVIEALADCPGGARMDRPSFRVFHLRYSVKVRLGRPRLRPSRESGRGRLLQAVDALRYTTRNLGQGGVAVSR